MPQWHGRVNLDSVFDRIDPTAADAISGVDGDAKRPRLDYSQIPRVRPMKIERLIEMGGPYTEEDQARLLYHRIGSAEKVAEVMEMSSERAHHVLAYDIAQAHGRKLDRPKKLLEIQADERWIPKLNKALGSVAKVAKASGLSEAQVKRILDKRNKRRPKKSAG